MYIPEVFFNLLEPHRYKVYYGGRGGAKSWAFATTLISKGAEKKIRVLCAREIQQSIEDSVYRLLIDIIRQNNLEWFYRIKRNEIIGINGTEFFFTGLYRNQKKIKSYEGFDICWVEEAEAVSQESWDYLIPTIRKEGSEIWITFNPDQKTDPVAQMFIENERRGAFVKKVSYKDNPFLPDTLKEEMEYTRDTNYEKYLWVWEGGYRETIEGALWSRDMIIHKTIPTDTEFEKIVVSIDPSVTAKVTSDACGLIVAGRKSKKEYIVLNDSTAIMSPQTWANKAVALYHRYRADHIVYESNQGGDLIKTVIRNIDPTIRVLAVHARRGKKIRAEEIVYLYEDGQVVHAGYFKTLEHEMVTFTGEKTEQSPNALDAMVYALKDLSPYKNRQPHGVVVASMGTMMLKTS